MGFGIHRKSWNQSPADSEGRLKSFKGVMDFPLLGDYHPKLPCGSRVNCIQLGCIS